MRFTACLFLCVFLCACAGNPPAWWNPSGIKPEQNAKASSVPRPSLPSSVSAEESDVFPAEQDIEPALESYEELNLSDWSSDSEAAFSSGGADSAPETEEAKLPASEEPKAEEHLPEDGSLPPPSVLE